ncbi:hypothetical protein O6P43_017725 [Quillaja saponaria]|uniref:Secreted protein n=1 Tax=Quillaja saponaria TaxID=32244 RepID=A0AAD7LQZ8_QUISA|nr:hypothetical protein O6P43_017725 [Quillaja saponaria]
MLQWLLSSTSTMLIPLLALLYASSSKPYYTAFASRRPSSTVSSYLGILSPSTKPNDIKSKPGVPISIGVSETYNPLLFFNISSSRCRSLLIRPSFSLSASRALCFSVRCLTGVGALRHLSYNFSLSCLSSEPLPLPPSFLGSATPFLVVTLERFNGCPDFSFVFPFGVPPLKHR